MRRRPSSDQYRALADKYRRLADSMYRDTLDPMLLVYEREAAQRAYARASQAAREFEGAAEAIKERNERNANVTEPLRSIINQFSKPRK